MIKLRVLDVLRAAKPDTMTAGQILGKLLENDDTVTRDAVLNTLRQLQHIGTGLVEEVRGVGVGPSEWRAR